MGGHPSEGPCDLSLAGYGTLCFGASQAPVSSGSLPFRVPSLLFMFPQRCVVGCDYPGQLSPVTQWLPKKKKGGRGEEKEPEFYSWWPSPLSPLNSARVAKSCAAPRVSWSRGIHKTSGGRMNIYCKSPSGLRAPDECLLGPGATRRGFQQAPPWVPSLASPLMSPGKLTS